MSSARKYVYSVESCAWIHQETKGGGDGGAATDEESEEGGRSQSTMVTRKMASNWNIAGDRGRGHGLLDSQCSYFVEGMTREDTLECLVVGKCKGVRIRTQRRNECANLLLSERGQGEQRRREKPLYYVLCCLVSPPTCLSLTIPIPSHDASGKTNATRE